MHPKKCYLHNQANKKSGPHARNLRVKYTSLLAILMSAHLYRLHFSVGIFYHTLIEHCRHKKISRFSSQRDDPTPPLSQEAVGPDSPPLGRHRKSASSCWTARAHSPCPRSSCRLTPVPHLGFVKHRIIVPCTNG